MQNRIPDLYTIWCRTFKSLHHTYFTLFYRVHYLHTSPNCLLIFSISEEGTLVTACFIQRYLWGMGTKSSFPLHKGDRMVEASFSLSSRPTAGRRASRSTRLGPQTQQFPSWLLGSLFLFTFYNFPGGQENLSSSPQWNWGEACAPRAQGKPFQTHGLSSSSTFAKLVGDLSISSNSTSWHKAKGSLSALTLGLKGKQAALHPDTDERANTRSLEALQPPLTPELFQEERSQSSDPEFQLYLIIIKQRYCGKLISTTFGRFVR